LATEADDIRGSFAAHGLTERQSRADGEWVAISFATEPTP
jgi:hypothetical protein